MRPLPSSGTLARRGWMTNDLHEAIRDQGFYLLERHEPSLDSLRVASTLGQVVCLPQVQDVQILQPKTTDAAAPNTYSGNFGLSAFPFHTDLAHWYRPPRFMVLRCVAGAPDVATRLLSADNLVRTLGRAKLRRTLLQPRRPIEFT